MSETIAKRMPTRLSAWQLLEEELSDRFIGYVEGQGEKGEADYKDRPLFGFFFSLFIIRASAAAR
jgi:hypothetical protein